MIRPCLEAGGATKTILDLAGGLRQRGHRVGLAVAGGEGLPRARELQVTCHILPLHPSTPMHLLWAARQLRTILRLQSVDLIHSHHRFAGLVARLATTGMAIPLVTTVHEYNYGWRRLTRLGAGHLAITFTFALRRHLIEYYNLAPEAIIVVPPGIRSGPATRPRAPGAARATIGCIARLIPEKGVDTLLQAVAHLRAVSGFKLHCMIAGDGPLMAALRRQAAQLRLEDIVTFLGWQDDILAFIAQVDFLVLPSRSEGLGLVVLEGWRQGRPTIGSDVGGISELIQDGYNGILVPADDAAALAAAIGDLIENPTFAEQLGQRGLQEKVPNHTIEEMVQKTEQVYRTCAATYD